MKFGLIETTALASLLLFLGYRVRNAIPTLHRLNIPAPVIGGFFLDFSNTLIITVSVNLLR